MISAYVNVSHCLSIVLCMRFATFTISVHRGWLGCGREREGERHMPTHMT